MNEWRMALKSLDLIILKISWLCLITNTPKLLYLEQLTKMKKKNVYFAFSPIGFYLEVLEVHVEYIS